MTSDNDQFLAGNGELLVVRKKNKDLPTVYIEATEPIRKPRPMRKDGHGKDFGSKWPFIIATINVALGITTKDVNLDDESLDLYRHIKQCIANKSRSFQSYRSDRAIQHAKKLGLHYMATTEMINVVLTNDQIEKLQVLVPRRKPEGSK